MSARTPLQRADDFVAGTLLYNRFTDWGVTRDRRLASLLVVLTLAQWALMISGRWSDAAVTTPLWVLQAAWTMLTAATAGRSMHERGQPWWLWAFLVIAVPVLGPLAWLYVQKRTERR